METIIQVMGLMPGKSEKAQWTVETDQGKFKVWPLSHGAPNPTLAMLSNGILQSFKISYTQEPDWTNTQGQSVKGGRTIDAASPANLQGVPSPTVADNQMQPIAAAVPQYAPAPQQAPQAPAPAPMPAAPGINYESLHPALQGQAKSLLEGGHAKTVLEALTKAESGIKAFLAGERWGDTPGDQPSAFDNPPLEAYEGMS